MLIMDLLIRLLINWPIYILSLFGGDPVKYRRRLYEFIQGKKGKWVGEDEQMKTSLATFDGVKVLVHEPKKRSGDGAIVYLHGGGFSLLSIRSYDCVTRQICEKSGLVVVSVEYRLAPEHKYPAAILDCEKAATHFLTNAYKKYGVDPHKVVIMGDSAGGNLTAVTVQRLRKLEVPQPKLQVLIYPWMQMVDFQLPSYQEAKEYSGTSLLSPEAMAKFTLDYLLGSNHDHYIPELLYNRHISKDIRQSPTFRCLRPKDSTSAHESDARLNAELHALLKPYHSNPDINPLIHPNLQGLPKTFVLTAEYDVLRDEAILYVDRLKQAGVLVLHKHYEQGFHGFVSYDVELSVQSIREIASFVIKNL